MRKKVWVLVLICCSFSSNLLCQTTDSLVKKLDSLSRKTDTAGQHNNISPRAYEGKSNLDLKTYFVLLGSDLKQEFTKPLHMTGKDWGKFAKFAIVVGGISLADEPLQQYAVRLTADNPGLQHASSYITNFGALYEIYTLAGFGAYGIIFKSDKMKTTTLLATQAYITGSALEGFLKLVSGRTRPSSYDPSVEAEPKFLGPFSKTAKDANGKNQYSSFPSGHTTVAFAAATVFAMEYKNQPYVPVIAYSAATLIGLSRITENKHWLSDVAVGATVGYLAGRQVVNNFHRFMKIRKSPKGNISFALGTLQGKVLPGLVYNFN